MIANARDAAATKPDVLLVKGANLPAVHDATTTIPVVFVMLSDAVAEGYVGSRSWAPGSAGAFFDSVWSVPCPLYPRLCCKTLIETAVEP
jgi:hypothetical protein